MAVSRHRETREDPTLTTTLVRKSGRTHVKWIFLFSKWFGLLVQMFGLLSLESFLCMLIPVFRSRKIWQYFLAAQCPVPPSTCQYFFIYGGITYQLLQLCLDAVLILRSESRSTFPILDLRVPTRGRDVSLGGSPAKLLLHSHRIHHCGCPDRFYDRDPGVFGPKICRRWHMHDT